MAEQDSTARNESVQSAVEAVAKVRWAQEQLRTIEGKTKGDRLRICDIDSDLSAAIAAMPAASEGPPVGRFDSDQTCHEHGILMCARCVAADAAPSDHDKLDKALSQISHSIKQARIPGNDWKRELALIENTVEALTHLRTAGEGAGS